jgi:hypothetical protein
MPHAPDFPRTASFFDLLTGQGGLPEKRVYNVTYLPL